MPWSDEFLYSQPTWYLLHRGHLATPAMSAVDAGFARFTYLQPPGYFLYKLPFFAVLPATLTTARLASVLVAVLSLLLLARLVWVVSGSWVAACFALGLLATDGLFVRAALMARMEMLVICLALLALQQTMRLLRAEQGNGRSWFALGVLCVLPLVVHPYGAVTTLAVLIAVATTAGRLRMLAPLAAGVACGLMPWLIYIARSPDDFVRQWGMQMARKNLAAHLSLISFYHGVSFAAAEYGLAPLLVWTSYICCAAGLLGAAWWQRRCMVFYQAAALCLLGLTGEIWYGVHLAPLCAAGTALLLTTRWRPLRLAGLLCGVMFAAFNTTHLVELHGDSAGRSYERLCADVSARLPAGSRVVVACFPDVGMGLLERSDLSLLEPANMPPLDAASYRRNLGRADYLLYTRDAYAGDATLQSLLRAGQWSMSGSIDSWRGASIGLYRARQN
jgi:hypothetical protein